jgi:hypothetical protein
MTAYINGPTIARLTALSRMEINRRQRAGVLGGSLRLGRRVYSQLPAVEAAFGVRFSDEQISAAVGRQPDRLVTIAHQEEPDRGIAAT